MVAFIMILPTCGLFAQTEIRYTLDELRTLFENSKSQKEKATYARRISYFFINNKFPNRTNIDSAIHYANLALDASVGDRKGMLYGQGQLALVQAKLKVEDPKDILGGIIANRDDYKIRILIEVGAFYLYKPREDKKDLDSALLLLNRAIEIAKSRGLQNLEHLAELFLCDVFRERRENIRSQLAFTTLIDKCQKTSDWENAAMASSRYGYHLPLNDEKLKSYRNAAKFYQMAGNTQGYIGEKKNIADAELNMGRLKESEDHLHEVLNLYTSQGFKNLQYTYDLLSVVYRLEGKLRESLSSALSALKYMQLTGSDGSKGYFLNNLGSVYAELGNTRESVKAFQKALDAVQYENPEVRLTSLRLLSDGLIKEGHIKEVLSLADLNDKDFSMPLPRLILSNIRGNAYNSVKRYDLAEKYYLQMIALEPELRSNFSHLAESYYTIAEFYAQRKQFIKSSYYYNRLLALPKGLTPLSNIRNIYYNLYQADSAQNNLSAAIQHYKIFKQLNDSLSQARSNRDMQELLIQYQANQKEQDNELLRKESILQKNKLQKAQWLTKVTFFGFFALLAIVGLSLYGYRNRQKANRLLESHQKEIEIKNESLQNLIDKQSKLLTEKEWLIKEIHHRIKNNLQVITSLLNAQSNYLKNDAALLAIRDSQNRIQSISLIHQKLFQSENVSLINIKSYIEELLRFLCDTFHVEQKISFEIDVPEFEIDIVQAMPLGLIINEAITNIIKYAFPAGTGLVKIVLSDLGDGFYEFFIKDDGVGIIKNITNPDSSSLGMTLIRGLGEQLSGQVNIISDNGVTIHIKFPVSIDRDI